jgi:hypothetical protein
MAVKNHLHSSSGVREVVSSTDMQLMPSKGRDTMEKDEEEQPNRT